jgi:hypothetical protein
MTMWAFASSGSSPSVEPGFASATPVNTISRENRWMLEPLELGAIAASYEARRG